MSDTLWVENFDEIALSCTVKEIEANLCFAIFGKNSKWPPFLGRGKLFKNCQEYISQIPCGWKISTKLLYLARLRQICAFHFWQSSYYWVSSIAIITKTDPKQAIDLSNAHTKFGKDMSSIFPENARKQKKYTKVAITQLAITLSSPKAIPCKLLTQ